MKTAKVGLKKARSERMPVGVQVIARAADILWNLRRYPQGTNLTQLARDVHLPRSTVHRIITALESGRLISFSSSAGYIQLGAGLAVLADSIPRDLRSELRPYLDDLFQEVNENIDLAVLQNDRAFFLEHLAAPHRLRSVSAVGLSFPLHCTANGKALLAQLSREEIERLLPAELEPSTPNTITERSRLLKELRVVKCERIGFDREEHTLGICAVGAAVRDSMGRLAAISIPVPSVRFYGNEQRLSSALLKQIDRIQLAIFRQQQKQGL